MKIKLLNLGLYVGGNNIKFPVEVECSGEFDEYGQTYVMGSEIIRVGGKELAFCKTSKYPIEESSFELIGTQNKMHWAELEPGDIILVEGVERTVEDIEYTHVPEDTHDGYTISLKEEDVGDLECTCVTWFDTNRHPWTFVRKAGQKAGEVTSEEGEDILQDVSQDFLYLADYGGSKKMLAVQKLTYNGIILKIRSEEDRFLGGIAFTPEQTIEFAEDLIRLAKDMIKNNK